MGGGKKQPSLAEQLKRPELGTEFQGPANLRRETSHRATFQTHKGNESHQSSHLCWHALADMAVMCMPHRAQSALPSRSSKECSRLGRLADGRVATAPPGGFGNPLAEDTCTGNTGKELLTQTLHSTPRVSRKRAGQVASGRFSTIPVWMR